MALIMALGAHPDDIEFGCGGILAKMRHLGHSVVMVDLTSGEKGSHGTPDIRKKEGLKAAKLIGAERIFLDFPDCEISDTNEGRLELVKIIRKYGPQLVLAPMWEGAENHPDHVALGKMARYACRYARFSKILPEFTVHTVQGILHYLQRNFDKPNFLVDVSPFIEIWKEMILCHESQLKTFDYLDWSLRAASWLGMTIGVPYAQGLVSSNPIVIEDMMDIARGTREL